MCVCVCVVMILTSVHYEENEVFICKHNRQRSIGSERNKYCGDETCYIVIYMEYQRNRSTTSQILTIRRILEGARIKKLQATLLFVDFTKAFYSIHRGKMEQILLAYGLPNETIAAIMILYKKTKVKVRSPDGDTEYFDIVAGVLQGNTLAPYLFIICLDYVLRTSIGKIRENGFELTKKRSRRYSSFVHYIFL